MPQYSNRRSERYGKYDDARGREPYVGEMGNRRGRIPEPARGSRPPRSGAAAAWLSLAVLAVAAAISTFAGLGMLGGRASFPIWAPLACAICSLPAIASAVAASASIRSFGAANAAKILSAVMLVVLAALSVALFAVSSACLLPIPWSVVVAVLALATPILDAAALVAATRVVDWHMIKPR